MNQDRKQRKKEIAMADCSDAFYMRRAIELAGRPVSAPHPNPRVGCVIVKDGRIVAEGFHRASGTAHAEIAALDAAPDVEGGTLYVTLEPCATHGRTPPCVERLLSAGIRRAVIADSDPNSVNRGLGICRLREAGIQTDVGTLAVPARALNRGFYARHQRGMPWVTAKIAATLDGRIATAKGESQWISGEAARADVQRLRAQSAAVMTGVGTVLFDNPRLSCRLDDVRVQPLRVIADSELRMPADARLFAEPGDILIAVSRDVSPQRRQIFSARASIVSFKAADGRVDCEKLLAFLAQQEINEVLVEAGPTLLGRLLQAQLIDEIVVYLAPAILGDSAMGMLRVPPIEALSDRYGGRFTDLRLIGDDVCLRMEFGRSSAG